MQLSPTSAARLVSALSAALALCLVAPNAPAQARARDKSASSQATKARELFKKSEESYRAGRFQEAVDLLTEAYQLDPNPVLLYNLARAYEGLGDTPKAIESYR